MRRQAEVVVIAATRTPIGRVGGSLRTVPLECLAARTIQAALSAVQLPGNEVNAVILGNVIGPGGNIARLALLEAGLPVEVPGYTVDMQCGSGLQAIVLAAQSILTGQTRCVLAGGAESCSRAPWRIEKPEDMYRGLPRVYGRARFSPAHLGDPDMGVAAENVARRYGIPREAQDAFALSSHQKAVKAEEDGFFDALRVAVTTPTGEIVRHDDCPRPDTSLEQLRALPPVFVEGGTVTAGNACPINDGASICLLTTASFARELGVRTALKYIDSTLVGVDPNVLGIGPVPAIRTLLERTGYRLEDVDLVEINEAFAAQVLACVEELQLPMEKLNIHGGAIALGHPYGSSGAVLVTHLFHTMMCQSDAHLGLTALGVGGGLGIAALWEKVDLTG
ncbi:thiolase family protein [Alicyclobacillus herbarius]|uniref:thiolase family protein n=1 Tax=Alicyclobacillus herbarius TaxID=122960 RepID=UPI000555109E|nr:thiolase family protein [Alicyclobacillus herbarius]